MNEIISDTLLWIGKNFTCLEEVGVDPHSLRR